MDFVSDIDYLFIGLTDHATFFHCFQTCWFCIFFPFVSWKYGTKRLL